jgi:hypothetical protein
VINWTNEEGARFPISMVSSGVWAGAIPLEKAYNLIEVGGGKATQKSELEKIGYLGRLEASHKANIIAAHFELQIEQGPILESSGGKIGAVEGVQVRETLPLFPYLFGSRTFRESSSGARLLDNLNFPDLSNRLSGGISLPSKEEIATQGRLILRIDRMQCSQLPSSFCIVIMQRQNLGA